MPSRMSTRAIASHKHHKTISSTSEGFGMRTVELAPTQSTTPRNNEKKASATAAAIRLKVMPRSRFDSLLVDHVNVRRSHKMQERTSDMQLSYRWRPECILIPSSLK